MSPAPSTPTGLMCRFGLLVERLRWTLADWVDRNPRNRDVLGPLALLLWKYLQRTTRKLAALHAQFAAGTLVSPALASATRKDRARRQAAERAKSTPPEQPELPSGPVLARFGAGYLGAWLLALVEDAEMQALLAASPQAGRLLRPLWRRLTNDPLPAPLRLPPKPPRSEQPLAPAALADAPGEAPGEAAPDTRAHSSTQSPPQAPLGHRRAASAKPPASLPPWPPPFFPA